jgi:uncharacterized protein (TIGR03000 family)
MLRRLFGATLPLLVTFGLFLRPVYARAQAMSKWGHPVFAIGWTPYDAVSTGHGNYPGSNGFIPGYGYYPGDFPSHYPWYDGPADQGLPGPYAHAHRPAAWAPAVEEAVPLRAAVLRVRVPADAEVWIADHRTAQRGAERIFLTPPLPDGRKLSYDLHARWIEDGKQVEQTRTIPVFPGDRLTIDFLTPAEEEASPLGHPRKLQRP